MAGPHAGDIRLHIAALLILELLAVTVGLAPAPSPAPASDSDLSAPTYGRYSWQGMNGGNCNGVASEAEAGHSWYTNHFEWFDEGHPIDLGLGAGSTWFRRAGHSQPGPPTGNGEHDLDPNTCACSSFGGGCKGGDNYSCGIYLQSIEGGPGFWTSGDGLPTKTMKWRIGDSVSRTPRLLHTPCLLAAAAACATAASCCNLSLRALLEAHPLHVPQVGCYSAFTGSPLFQFGQFAGHSCRSETAPGGVPIANGSMPMGFIALSNRMVMFPDGISLSKYGLLGVGYLKTPLGKVNSTDTRNAWTVVLDSTSFSGPLGYFLPEFWKLRDKKIPDATRDFPDFSDVKSINVSCGRSPLLVGPYEYQLQLRL
jgi:hypothetical protein